LILAVGNSFAQHATFGFRKDLLAGKKLIHVNIDNRRDRQGLQGRRGDHRGRQAGHRRASCQNVRPARSLPPLPVERHDYSQERIIHLIGKIHPGQMAQALSRQLPDNAIMLADAGAHLAWLGYYLELSSGQRFRKPGGFGRWPAM